MVSPSTSLLIFIGLTGLGQPFVPLLRRMGTTLTRVSLFVSAWSYTGGWPYYLAGLVVLGILFKPERFEG